MILINEEKKKKKIRSRSACGRVDGVGRGGEIKGGNLSNISKVCLRLENGNSPEHLMENALRSKKINSLSLSPSLRLSSLLVLFFLNARFTTRFSLKQKKENELERWCWQQHPHTHLFRLNASLAMQRALTRKLSCHRSRSYLLARWMAVV